MTDKDAIEAARLLIDYCDSFIECKDCVFCLNPQEEVDGYRECFFRENNLSPSFWDKFLEAQHDD